MALSTSRCLFCVVAIIVFILANVQNHDISGHIFSLGAMCLVVLQIYTLI